jgi:hypothetical protein
VSATGFVGTLPGLFELRVRHAREIGRLPPALVARLA